jgi:hypothetical protein
MSGFHHDRAAFHDHLLPIVHQALARRGYPSDLLPVSGHIPDGKFHDGIGYWDLKTGGPNLTIEQNDIDAWQKLESEEQTRVYVIHANVEDERAWSADTLEAIMKRRIGDRVYTRSGIGSRDNGLLFARGGVPFKEFFEWRQS